MTRSLKLTKVRAEHPGGLGARPKRDKSSTRAYPTLHTTEEETDENKTNRTKNWVDNKSINRAAKKEVNTKEDVNTKPPDYDQSIGFPHKAAQVNPQMQYNLQFNQGMYQPPFPVNNLQNTAMMSGFN